MGILLKKYSHSVHFSFSLPLSLNVDSDLKKMLAVSKRGILYHSLPHSIGVCDVPILFEGQKQVKAANMK